MEEVYCDRKRQAYQAAATTYLLRGDRTGHGQNFQYIAHPISIDSMLQAAFVATTAGHVSDLRATVPVAIDSLQISAPSLLDMDLNKSWSIDTISEKVGFGTASIFAELYNSFDQVELSKYLDWFIQDSISKGLELDKDLLRLAGALDLAVHKKPGRDILQLGEHHSIEAFVLKLLRSDSPSRRFNTYTRALLSDNKEIRGTEISFTNIPNEKSSEPAALDPSKKFDIIFLTSSQCKLTLSYLDSLLAPGAVIISTEIADVSGTRKPPAVTIDIIQRPPPTTDKMEDATVIMVNRDGDMSEFELDIKQELESYFRMSIPMVCLSQVSNTTVPDRSIVVSTLEARKPLLTAIDGDEMKQLQDITGRVAVILWICGGDFLDMDCPEFAPVLGMSRALMAEQPSLRFAVLGVDDLYASKATSGNVKKIMRQLLCGPFPDLEFTQKNGVIHVLRWEPEERLNTTFRLKQGLETTHVPLERTGRLKLNIKDPGQLDTIHFVHEEYPIPLPSDHIQIQVKTVGDGVSGLRPGDRVVAMGPGHFATVERLPQWAVQKLLDNEEFTTASTIPIVFSTVIYGLKHRANLKAGETILIHSAAGGVGMAAVQYAKYLGAKIFATAGNKSKKKFLAERFGLDPAHIFSSRDSSFLPAIRSATNGQGVDVVLNSLTDELLQSSFEACAEFGRFIEIGKRDILDHRALDMGTFARNVTFSAFDLSSLFHSKKDEHHQLWQKLLAESLDFIRTGIFQPCSPIEVFDVSDITSAFRYFSLGTRIGKVAVSFEDGQSNIRAKDLVDDLQDHGANVKVVRGDVSKYGDVECAVRAAQGPIGGVIQAAMALKESLWSQMPHWGWHTTIGPKIQGTWNIHNALLADGRDAQVDFFVMTSSIAGTVGTATESNYCAANAFLDAFARYRNKLGLPAISVGYGMISEVGYLHEHPEIEAFMKRRGIHSINEDEVLQIMDLAITNQLPETWTPYYDRLVGSHILTGVEFEDLKQLRDQGFEGDNTLITDPRAALFGAALKRSINHQSFSSAGGSNLSEQVLKALRDTSRNNTAVLNALGDIISQKVSSLILLPEGKLKSDQQLGNFGLDSMLAAEFRAFIFHALGVDVPFVMFLSHTTTVDSLVTFIAEGLRVKS
ncbi:putative secondary metabolism biosynthetic enzyme [Paecilomyces lecythidis]|uniref:Secondary metabolism biosynthetic enzyme n=1 Tax=Paecilomyces lecythidis TaxID=3004212 RepID=A0ABR3WZW7_9EURO